MALAIITKGTMQFITLRQQTPSVDTHCLSTSNRREQRDRSLLTISGQHQKTAATAALTRDHLNTNQYPTYSTAEFAPVLTRVMLSYTTLYAYPNSFKTGQQEHASKFSSADHVCINIFCWWTF
jgi:hypothetical protein